MAYTVIRTDLMSGTAQPADLVSLRFYDGEDEQEALKALLHLAENQFGE